jgi:serine/threonine protein kinase
VNCHKCATPLPDHSRFCMACGADVSGEGHSHETVNIEPDPELLAALQAELGSEFTVERELGRGGMAIVYLGQDAHLGRKVAIKLLPPMLTFGGGPSLIERFKREARTAATLDHPNIIPVYRVSTGGKLFWYVMKYLQGESLDAVLKREGQMDIDRAVEILTQAADALDYAHQNNVVHRDIKPANIMLDKRGRVVVTDFGIAKALDTSGLTGSGAAIGTPHYMSPEQCNGIGVAGASDQYSLAITAYQMFCGHVPFSSDSMLELMRMHMMDPPPPLDTLRPQAGPALAAAVERALAKTARERFPTCMDFVRELQRATLQIEKQARVPTTSAVPDPEATTPVTPLAPPTATVVEEHTLAAEKPKVWLVGGGATIAAIVVVVAIVLWPKTEPIAPAPSSRTSSLVIPQAQSTKAPDSTNTRSVTQTKRPARDTTRRIVPPVSPPVGLARITVGSRPISAISVNGRPVPSNPVLNLEVPSGRVTIRFQVTDSTGVWSVDTTLTVSPGETRNLGRVQLKRP